MLSGRVVYSDKANDMLSRDQSISGFNVGLNIGQSAGQIIFHVHMHLIPRRDDDVGDPRGGVRGVIASKQKYETT